MSHRPRRVIWITTDHMRYDGIAAHGSDWMHTPHLDRLVAGGIDFARCYANNPLCMPSRCSFMTGCYPQITGVMRNGQELPADFAPTVARCFGAGGYQTVQIGKLHFQNHQDHDLDPRARADYGFDVFQLSEEAGCYEDAYRTWLRGEHPELVPLFTTPRAASRERHEERHRHQVLDAPWRCSHSGWIATQATRFLGSWGRSAQSRFLHLGFYAPHPPLNPTREMFAPYENRVIPPGIADPHSRSRSGLDAAQLDNYRRHFAAMITGVDLAIGTLLDDLAANDELDDTLLVFSSDHGDLCGDHGGVAKNDSWYEGIMRLPLILHWPNGFGPVGRTVTGLTEMVDLLPTLLGCCNLPIPERMQGRDYSADLLAGRQPSGREDVYAVHGATSLMVRSETWKYLRYQRDENAQEVLYHLAEDPDELHDRAGDPACHDTLLHLRERALVRTLHASTSRRPQRGLF